MSPSDDRDLPEVARALALVDLGGGWADVVASVLGTWVADAPVYGLSPVDEGSKELVLSRVSGGRHTEFTDPRDFQSQLLRVLADPPVLCTTEQTVDLYFLSPEVGLVGSAEELLVLRRRHKDRIGRIIGVDRWTGEAIADESLRGVFNLWLPLSDSDVDGFVRLSDVKALSSYISSVARSLSVESYSGELWTLLNQPTADPDPVWGLGVAALDDEIVAAALAQRNARRILATYALEVGEDDVAEAADEERWLTAIDDMLDEHLDRRLQEPPPQPIPPRVHRIAVHDDAGRLMSAPPGHRRPKQVAEALEAAMVTVAALEEQAHRQFRGTANRYVDLKSIIDAVSGALERMIRLNRRWVSEAEAPSAEHWLVEPTSSPGETKTLMRPAEVPRNVLRLTLTFSGLLEGIWAYYQTLPTEWLFPGAVLVLLGLVPWSRTVHEHYQTEVLTPGVTPDNRIRLQDESLVRVFLTKVSEMWHAHAQRIEDVSECLARSASEPAGEEDYAMTEFLSTHYPLSVDGAERLKERFWESHSPFAYLGDAAEDQLADAALEVMTAEAARIPPGSWLRSLTGGDDRLNIDRAWDWLLRLAAPPTENEGDPRGLVVVSPFGLQDAVMRLLAGRRMGPVRVLRGRSDALWIIRYSNGSWPEP